MLGVIIGITSVVTIVSLGEGLKQTVAGHVNRLGHDVITVRSGKLVDEHQESLNLLAFLSPSTLTDQDVRDIGLLDSVEAVVPIKFVTSSVSSDSAQLNNIFVIGTSPRMDDVLREELSYGSFFSQDNGQQYSAVLGADIAQRLTGQRNAVGQSVQILGRGFTVSGVLKPSVGGLLSVAQTNFNLAVFIPSVTATTLTEGRSNILQVLVKAEDPAQVPAVTEQINRTLNKNHGDQADFTVLKQNELLGIAGRTVDDVTKFISGIAAISLIVGGIGIMAIMMVSVSERTREIGIRKALGATNRQILVQFLSEGIVLTALGGLIGIACSLLIYLGLRLYTDFQPIITVPMMALAVGVSVAVGIIFSTAPAIKAARKDPIAALRSE
jgi:putative ABC transport system permease protein